MQVTSDVGGRAYIRVDDELSATQTEHRATALAAAGRAQSIASAVVLSRPIEAMLDDVESLLFNRLSEAQRAAEPAAGRRGAGVGDGGRRSGSGRAGGKPGAGELWVQKYGARTFLELLSDERVNRGVLQWLKSWDPCVFRRSAAPARRGLMAMAAAGGGAGAPVMADVPEHKVILISGPPGV